MSTSEIDHLANCITTHAWNGDRSKVAISPNSNEVMIYTKKGNTFELEQILQEHDQVITSIDWAPKTNRIVTASQDRNAFVWNYEKNEWKPTLVILRINRAATYVKWSPLENKFAVASGAKCVSVCYFEEDSNWWISKHIKKHKSTVLKVDWHPNNCLLVTGSSDFKCRVFSAHIKVVDKELPRTVFGDKLVFGEPLLEMNASGWVHGVKWSPSGNLIAFASHDSSLCIANVSNLPPTIQKVNLRGLPIRDLLFLSENSLVGVGEDCNPLLFQSEGGNWAFVSEIDKKSEQAAASGDSAAGNARKLFASKVTLGAESVTDTKLETQHQNCITSIRALTAGAVVSDFSTVGLDGNLIVWHTKALEAKFKELKIK
eukprot:TRINITY_DN6116_c0_g1_i1.p1 TRINITY_DN6116_c0_g1~~TRINITY_DN6116_c0_g1_i1.p1  ORF type:complete len:373 (+),score=81.94 TRINITY_DN6116_c0_g1_i1:126-1244(+)